MTALASYKEAREALKNQKLSRGYFPPMKGHGKGKSKNKVHIEQLKLRTRCWKCDAIGHWGRERTNPDKNRVGSEFEYIGQWNIFSVPFRLFRVDHRRDKRL